MARLAKLVVKRQLYACELLVLQALIVLGRRPRGCSVAVVERRQVDVDGKTPVGAMADSVCTLAVKPKP